MTELLPSTWFRTLALSSLAVLVLGLAPAAAHPHRRHHPPGARGGPGTNWQNPPGPRGGPGASRLRRGFRSNPPGPAGGRGTNWANPPGPGGRPRRQPVPVAALPRPRPQPAGTGGRVRGPTGRTRPDGAAGPAPVPTAGRGRAVDGKPGRRR